VQAVGRDARGRKQYRYHASWRAHRDAKKYHRMLRFARCLPVIRRRVVADLRRLGLPREKVVALLVRLLEGTAIRVGNEEYARTNGSRRFAAAMRRSPRAASASPFAARAARRTRSTSTTRGSRGS
jgi:DNA topoisomerase IB